MLTCTACISLGTAQLSRLFPAVMPLYAVPLFHQPTPLVVTARQDGLSSEDRATLAAVQSRLAELEQQLEGLQGKRDTVGAEAAGMTH